MEKVSNDIRINFNNWFERFCEDKDGDVLNLTVGDIWNAYLAGTRSLIAMKPESERGMFEHIEGQPLRTWKELSNEEKAYLDELSIEKGARYMKQITINSLARNKVRFYGQLVRLSRTQLLKLNGIAGGAIESIRKDIKNMGLKLSPCYQDYIDEE